MATAPEHRLPAPASSGSTSNAAYDRATIDAILDAALVCHLGFERDGQPFVIPTLHARIGDLLYVHGSSASRTVRALGEGIPACVTVTLLDGIVLARSVFEHSINYRSVVVLGTATAVTDPGREERRARGVHREAAARPLGGRAAADPQGAEGDRRALTPDRRGVGQGARPALLTTESHPDAELDVWAGHIPLVVHALPPVPAPELRPGIPMPAYATALPRQAHRLSRRHRPREPSHRARQK